MNDKNLKKKPLKKYITLFLGFVIICIFMANILIIATAEMFTPKPASVTVLYDPTDTTLATTAINIKDYVGRFTTANIIPVTQGKSLLALINKISNPIIYVFHGNTAGWKVGNDFIMNNILSSTIQNSPSAAHFLVVCDSDTLALTISNKYVGNLFGITDAQVGTILIEEQLLSYFSTHGLDQKQYTQLEDNLQTYIQGNGMAIFSRLLYPVQPLYCYSPNTASSQAISPMSSYYGPSGFYVTSSSTSAVQDPANTILKPAVTAVNKVISILNTMPGTKYTLNAQYHVVSGNAVYSYRVGVGCQVTWYSIVNPVSFNYMSLSVSASFDLGSTSASSASLSTAPTTSSTSGIPLSTASTVSIATSSLGDLFSPHSFSAGLAFIFATVSIIPDTPSFETGGTLGYTTGVTYTTAPTNSNCQYYTDQWINTNVQPNTWSKSLYLQINMAFSVSLKLTFGSYSYTLTAGGLSASVRTTFNFDGYGNLIASETGYAKYTSGDLGIPYILTFNAKLLLIPGGIQMEGDSSSNIYAAVYSGIYFDVKATLLGQSQDLPVILPFTYWNNLPDGTSVNTIISNLANVAFG